MILAPHLVTLRKVDVGLPHIDNATESQKRDGMCWENEDELYNDGGAFKVACRDARGVMVTLIADNYFGYCKKEVKTQISYAANLYGLAEEEHAGGAIAFAGFDLGEDFQLSDFHREVDHDYDEVLENFGQQLLAQPEGYAIDKNYSDIFYVSQEVHIDLNQQRLTWEKDSAEQSLRMQPDATYVLPSGYKVNMRQPAQGQRWRLIGINAEGTLCHKPCTVSGGGKSEISKSLTDAMESGSIFMPDFANDMRKALEIINRNYGDRRIQPRKSMEESRKILDPKRSLGSTIRLLSPSPDFTDEYNEWVRSVPRSVRDLVFTIKRYWKPRWGDDWADRFHVDSVNGAPGYELKYRRSKLVARYLRVGFHEDGSWRMFGLRKDFYEAAKLQREDDITASITVATDQLTGLHPYLERPAHKFIENCEYRLFQRPDDAIHRGYDKGTESDFSLPGNFFSNYEPIDRAGAQQLLDDTIRFEQFTEPMKRTIREFLADEDGPDYVISSAHPRIVDGKPTKNPRYLQNRPNLAGQRDEYLAELGSRLYRRAPFGQPAPSPVNAVLPGRRNNPADPKAGIRPLAVYSPIHYQELPELFMDFIPSLTGKSPSTTGAGSEGALTKGPFNALLPIVDLNNALVSYLLAEYPVFTTSAGWIGSKYRIDHDISLIIPEVWSRMFIAERDPKPLMETGRLEKIEDFEHNGQTVLASRLGWRITESFVHTFFGRVFNDPDMLFPDDMLRPEKQNIDEFVDGVNNIVETQQRIAKVYFDDGSIEHACPPLKALLHIMAHGDFEGKDVHHPEIRALFTREQLLASEWYQDRLQAKTEIDRALYEKQARHLEEFLNKEHYAQEAERLQIREKLDQVRERIEALRKRPKEALDRLTGTIGADPSLV